MLLQDEKMAFYTNEDGYLVHKEYPIEGQEFPCLELCIEKVNSCSWALHINYWFKEKRFDWENWTDKWGKSLIKWAEMFTRLKDAKKFWETFEAWFHLWYLLWEQRGDVEV